MTVPVGTKLNSGATELKLTITEDEVDDQITLDTKAGYDVTVEGVSDDNTMPIVIYMPNALPAEQTAIQLSHDGVLMERVDTIAAVSGASSQGVYGDRYYYDSATGDVTFSVTHFSNVSISAGTTVKINGENLGEFDEIKLNEQTGDVTIKADERVILTWDSGDTSKVNPLDSNPIIAIFTNETPNPGNYFEHSIIVEAGAKVVLNGVNVRTNNGKEALIINDLGAYTTDTYIYVADGTRNWLTGQSGIGFSGTKTWSNNLHIEGGGFLHATATEWGFPAIGPNGMER